MALEHKSLIRKPRRLQVCRERSYTRSWLYNMFLLDQQLQRLGIYFIWLWRQQSCFLSYVQVMQSTPWTSIRTDGDFIEVEGFTTLWILWFELKQSKILHLLNKSFTCELSVYDKMCSTPQSLSIPELAGAPGLMLMGAALRAHCLIPTIEQICDVNFCHWDSIWNEPHDLWGWAGNGG